MNNEEKIKIIKDVRDAAYSDFLRLTCAIEYRSKEMAKEIKEDETIDKLSDELGTLKEDAKNSNLDKNNPEDLEKIKEIASRIAYLDGRIDYINKSNSELSQAKENLKMSESYIDTLSKMLTEIQ